MLRSRLLETEKFLSWNILLLTSMCTKCMVQRKTWLTLTNSKTIHQFTNSQTLAWTFFFLIQFTWVFFCFVFFASSRLQCSVVRPRWIGCGLAVNYGNTKFDIAPPIVIPMNWLWLMRTREVLPIWGETTNRSIVLWSLWTRPQHVNCRFVNVICVENSNVNLKITSSTTCIFNYVFN